MPIIENDCLSVFLSDSWKSYKERGDELIFKRVKEQIAIRSVTANRNSGSSRKTKIICEIESF
ncbi:MAG: hypothetical protein BHV91_03045 [Clostridiales bacterium 44_9]|nr:MAG: hypothetical protein BHV91_03045 [Clostridiales bacterium 44_9]